MTYYSMNKYVLLGFEPSNRTNKKYTAVLKNKVNNNYVFIHFGDKRYQQYKDTTGLNLYKHLNHKDKKRRLNYHKRHQNFIKDGYYSPGYFSMRYLW